MLDKFFILSFLIFITLFCFQLFKTFQQKAEDIQVPPPQLQKLSFILKISFGVFLLSSIVNFIQNKNVLFQYHIALVVLFYVAFSSNLKSIQAEKPNEKKMGIFVAGIAYVGIIALLVLTPGNKIG